MKENKDILNEAFFKKKSRKDALNLPEYTPTTAKNSGGFLAGAYQVTDNDEVKRRLSSSFGVAFGNNNVKSMASKAVKQFPILVSDNVEPETVIMLKKLMEEQYAEYISLLVSNQVIDLSDYSAGEQEGNIAIQALDTLSGGKSVKNKIAGKSGTIGADDIFGNMPLYSLLRENQQIKVQTPDESVNSILEDAIIIPSEYTENMYNFIMENASDIVSLTEEPTGMKRGLTPDFRKDGGEDPDFIKGDEYKEYESKRNKLTLKKYFMDDFSDTNDTDDANTLRKILNREKRLDMKRGFVGITDDGEEIYSKLTTADIVLDKDRMDKVINRSVGNMLTDESNVEIRDRFEKATFLLQSRRIAGIEYYNYLTLRLGIPVSDKARQTLVKDFKISDIRSMSGSNKSKDIEADTFTISNEDVKAIAANKNRVKGVVEEICRPTLGQQMLAGAAGAAVGAGVGAGAASILGLALMGPLGWGAIAGAAVGSGAIWLRSLTKKYKEKRSANAGNKMEGWERVERLIDAMNLSQAEVTGRLVSDKPAVYDPSVARKNSTDRNYADYIGRVKDDVTKNYQNVQKRVDKLRGTLSGATDEPDTVITDVRTEYTDNLRIEDEYKKAYKDMAQMIDKTLVRAPQLREDLEVPTKFTHRFPNSYLELIHESLCDVCDELGADPEYKALTLSEASLKLNTLDKGPSPITVKYVEKRPNANVLYTPSSLSTRTNFAYGSTEIERKENKDRRYDQPLVMTVKFKERFSDGKYADNELTAVIGILGKVIRIPSAEMEYVLKENVEGKTLDGFFKSGITNKISDMLSTSKISKDLKGMPKSADIWKNLEKVSTLAAANSISGRRNSNIANAHIVFSQKEIDNIRTEMDIDYLRDTDLTIALMKRYSALTVMVANDAGQRAYILDDQDAISWNVVPYSALHGKDSGDQLTAAMAKLSRL